MSTLAEIEHAVEALPPDEQRALFRLLAARFETRPASTEIYRTKTRPGGIRPGIDPDKLGQLPENF